MVGGGDQPVRKRAGLAGPLRDPDRDRDRDVVADTGLGILATHIQHAARDHGAFAQRRRRQHDAELVAAGARQQVAGPQPRLRHQREMLQAGIARGMTMGVVDLLEAVEIDHQKRKRLAAALRAGAFLGEALHQLPSVADAGEIIQQREIGDLVAQPVDRHQQETEIERHRQEDQRQGQRALRQRRAHEGKIEAEQVAEGPDRIKRDDQAGDAAGQPGARVGAAVGAREQEFQGQRQRHRLAGRIDQDPHRTAVIAGDEEDKAGAGQAGDQRGLRPGHRALVKSFDAHGGEADREDQHNSAGKQGQQRAGEDHDQHRHGAAERADGRRGRPEPRGLEPRIGKGDIGPDQGHREKVNDEDRPQCRNAQHRDRSTSIVLSPCPTISPFCYGQLGPGGLTESQLAGRNHGVVLN